MSEQMIEVVHPETGAVFVASVGTSKNGKRELTWPLAVFQAKGAEPLILNGKTWGTNEFPRSAIGNFSNWQGTFNVIRGYLARNNRLHRKDGEIEVSVPATLHVTGYDGAIPFNLEQLVKSGRDEGLALTALANQVKRAVTNYAYAAWPREQEDEGEELPPPETIAM
jgi:hypothetical protein